MADRTRGPRLSRRHLIQGAAGIGATGLGVGAGFATARTIDDDPVALGARTVEFFGSHQAGVTTPPQSHAQFVGLDLADNVRTPRDLDGILRIWTQDASLLASGRAALADTEPEIAAVPAGLTITIGLGPTVFDRLRLTERRPRWLRPLPAFSIDRLDDAWGQTDLLLQVCADDPITVAHAVRVLTKNVRTKVRTRWMQRGFRNTPGAVAPGATMRNLMGSVDGTVNPTSTAEHDALVWDDGRDQPWMTGGTSLVLRRIAMNLDTWEELDREGRELSVGRKIDTGAPLTGEREHDEADFTATRNGIPIIPEGSHIARAHHRHAGEQFLRRAYNYDDPPRPGELSNVGLIFATYQRDIDAQFLPVQRRLDQHDALNEWTTPIGSAVYAILPGTTSEGYLGSGLTGSFAAAP